MPATHPGCVDDCAVCGDYRLWFFANTHTDAPAQGNAYGNAQRDSNTDTAAKQYADTAAPNKHGDANAATDQNGNAAANQYRHTAAADGDTQVSRADAAFAAHADARS